MKALLLSTVLVSALVAGGVAATWGALREPAAPVRVELPAAADAGLVRRVSALEARLDEMAAGMELLRRQAAEAREAERKTTAELRQEVVRQKEKADAAEALMSGYTLEPRPGIEKKPEDMDAFAKAVSKGMRQGIREEFRKISDLITNPTPEGLDARRRQLKMFAAAFGANAGLDQAQVATLERILNDTDEKAREDLRPILQGVEDYRAVDYGKVRKVTDDSFAAQNEQFDKEFPKDKSDRLKRQLDPIRNVFGAMIDELGKESAAPEAPK
jgi:hypothetical protein